MSGIIDDWAETNHFDNTICPLECRGKDDIDLLKIKIEHTIDEWYQKQYLLSGGRMIDRTDINDLKKLFLEDTEPSQKTGDSK